MYRDSILLEAERQKTAFGRVEDWAAKLLELSEDDVFATFIQVYLKPCATESFSIPGHLEMSNFISLPWNKFLSAYHILLYSTQTNMHVICLFMLLSM